MTRKDTKAAPAPRAERKDAPKPRYEAPRIVTHSGEKILEELGPAQACYPFSGD